MDIVELIISFLGGATTGAIITVVLKYFFDKKKYFMDVKKELYLDILRNYVDSTDKRKNTQTQILNNTKMRLKIALLSSEKTIKIFNKFLKDYNTKYWQKSLVNLLNVFRSEIKIGKCSKQILSEIFY